MDDVELDLSFNILLRVVTKRCRVCNIAVVVSCAWVVIGGDMFPIVFIRLTLFFVGYVSGYRLFNLSYVAVICGL